MSDDEPKGEDAVDGPFGGPLESTSHVTKGNLLFGAPPEAKASGFKAQVEEVERRLKEALPPGMGFLLYLYETEAGGRAAYACSEGQRGVASALDDLNLLVKTA